MMKRNYDPATPMLESEVAQSANSPAIVLEGAHGYSAVSEITVTTPAAKT